MAQSHLNSVCNRCPYLPSLSRQEQPDCFLVTQLLIIVSDAILALIICQEKNLALERQATRAWNPFTALYYKARGIPWGMKRDESDIMTCYLGVSFFPQRSTRNAFGLSGGLVSLWCASSSLAAVVIVVNVGCGVAQSHIVSGAQMRIPFCEKRFSKESSASG